jgi:hypothetical protein
MARIKSKAQRRKFAELLVAGKIDKDVYERWNRGAGSRALPEHAGDKRKRRQKKSKRQTRRKSSRGSKRHT